MATKDRRRYAEQRVKRLKAKLDCLQRQFDPKANEKTQKSINSTKWTLRRWLREFPDMDPEFLASITR